MWLLALLFCRDLTSDNMWVRCLGFAVLVCTTGVLHGSPLSPGSNEGDTGLLFTTLDKCGRIPLVEGGVFEQVGMYVLKYQCSQMHKLEGPEFVVCHSNGTWSQTPACTANLTCSVDTKQYEDLKSTGVKLIQNGETDKLECVDKFLYTNYALVACEDGTLTISKCCNKVQISTNVCWIRGTMTDSE